MPRNHSMKNIITWKNFSFLTLKQSWQIFLSWSFGNIFRTIFRSISLAKRSNHLGSLPGHFLGGNVVGNFQFYMARRSSTWDSSPSSCATRKPRFRKLTAKPFFLPSNDSSFVGQPFSKNHWSDNNFFIYLGNRYFTVHHFSIALDNKIK